MRNSDNGGPAYPAPEASQFAFGSPNVYMGATLLDMFACQAMAALINSPFPDVSEPSEIATRAYAIGRAMLEEKAK